jgi:SecD/SecF fusion protein
VGVVATATPTLGLDLRGGTQIVLETKDADGVEADAEGTDRAVEVLRRRVDALGVSEPSLTRSGEKRIIVELPDVQDPTEAAEAIGRTAQLTFHPVTGIPRPKAKDPLLDEDGSPVRISDQALSGQDVTDSGAGTDESGTQWLVNIDFNDAGGRAWAELTAEAACAPAGAPQRRVAILLDDQVISSPQVDAGVACDIGIRGGSTQITGQFSADEAKELSALIRGGALPLPVEIIEQRVVGPTLGEEAIEASWKAALIGISLTLLFLTVVYRLFGFLAVVGLLTYALISYAALIAIGATLTLPGLAGFVLAVGMAVDANVLVFERAREEFATNGGRLSRAVTDGFRHAFTAIIDSNITTLLAAGLLFFLASGPVRGFGVTLSLGVLASMFSALVVVRLFLESVAGLRRLRSRPALSGVSSIGRLRTWLNSRDPQILAWPRRWLLLSAVLAAVAVAGIGVRGMNFGVEFTGGRLVEYSASAPIDADLAREAVADAGFPRAVVQESGDGDVSVRTEALSNDEETEIEESLGELAPGLVQQRDELIGPSLGEELRIKALIALGVALAMQLLYLAVRFRWTYASATVLAMAHDIAVVIGVFAWLGKPIDGVFLAAVLTVIGYSVNDTVVVFDRVRERRASAGAESWVRSVNTAVLQTVPRTVNTGLGAVFILSALFVLGGDSLGDFALALLIGIAVGTFSSSFTAAPALIELETRRPGTPQAKKPRAAVDPYGSVDPASDRSGAVI